MRYAIFGQHLQSLVGVLRQPILIKASEWLERFLYQHADLVVVNSPGFIKHTWERGAENVELVPNGSDTSMFNPQKIDMESIQYWSHPGKFVALYAGAHGMSNDLEIVLQAAALLNDRLDIFIVLLGDGKEKPALQDLAQELELSNLQFLPPIPKNEMPAALASCRCLHSHLETHSIVWHCVPKQSIRLYGSLVNQSYWQWRA